MRSWPLLIALLVTLALAPATLLAEDPPAPEAQTTAEPEIPVDELQLMRKPMTKAELIVEADAWLGLVQDKARQIVSAEIAVKRQNDEIAEVEKIRQELELAKEQLREVQEEAEEAAAEVRESAEDARSQMLE